MSWTPLLDGDAARAAAAWRDAIADELAAPDWLRFADAYARVPAGDERRARAAGLSGGCSGGALLHARLGRVDDARALETRALETLGEVELGAGLFKGLTGVAWVAAHLAAELDLDAEDLLAQVDAALAATAADPDARVFDLGDGLAGLGVYFLERLPRAGDAAVAALDAIVARLGALAVGGPDGAPAGGEAIAWRAAARPQVALGMAHGVTGVIALCARVVAEVPAVAPRARPLLDGAVAWVLARRWPARTTALPGAIDLEHGALEARHGWCEGDAAVALALAAAGRAAARDDWAAAARAIAQHAARRDGADGGVDDVGVCHGAAGLAHVFHRLHVATGDPSCRAAARAWLDRAIAMRAEGAGAIAGVRARQADGTWAPSAGLFMGAAGVALVLDAALGEREPAWDRALGLSGVSTGSPP